MQYQSNTTGYLYSRLKYIKQRIFNSNRYKLTKRIVEYLQSDDCSIPVTDKLLILKCFSKTLVYPIGYPFIREYLYKKINVFQDKTRSLYYVYHNKKKLYFKKGLSKNDIREMYNALCIELDTRSPHSYFAFPAGYQSTDIAADVGAAEGIWALDIVEKVKEIYLFECDATWVEALRATFEPWKNKVYIINKYVSSFTDEKNTALDDYFCGKNTFPTIIKIDIEGSEIECINGASTLLTQYIRYALICTYHRYDDYAKLSEIIKKYSFEIHTSKGYMIFYWEEPDYNCNNIGKLFRKGLIYACR